MTIDLYTVGACVVLAGCIACVVTLGAQVYKLFKKHEELVAKLCNQVSEKGELLAICSWRKDELEEKVRDAIQAAHDTNDLKAVLEILERSE